MLMWSLNCMAWGGSCRYLLSVVSARLLLATLQGLSLWCCSRKQCLHSIAWQHLTCASLMQGGNAYNQLAVLATLSDDKLSAVYFYFRSLAVAVPFGIARENLMLLFEANRVSFEGLPPRRGPDLDKLMKAMQQQPVNLLLQEFTVRLIHLHGEPLLSPWVAYSCLSA